MKKVLLIITILFLISCKKEETKKEPLYSTTETAKTLVELGQEIFEGRGNCASCHQLNQKIIGPSIQDIAQKYKENKGDIVAFLKGEAEPIVDPSQYEVMKTNFAITKTMSETELKSLEAYFYSNLK